MRCWLRVVLVALVVLILAVVAISAFIGHTLTRAERLSIKDKPGSRGIDYTEVQFQSSVDAITLRGWHMMSPDSDRIIIMVHGASDHRASRTVGMLDIAVQLLENGYDVLTFDLRGHGESDGNRISGGYFEQRDVLGAVEYVKTLGFHNIGLLGFSVGAVSSLLAAAQSTDIDALVADSSFADLNDIVAAEFKKRAHLPAVFLPPLLLMVKIMYGVDFAELAPAAYVAKIAPRPVFVIHGALDKMIPANHARRLKQAAQGSADQLWIAPGAAHVRAFATHPREYMQRILAFYDSVWQ